ncbi:MAG: DNA-3-methyladenine glycosylase, partial [Jatrophihabitantaceae bacterium]
RGPARLATCLGLDAGTNGADLCAADSPVRLEQLRTRRVPGIVTGPRVGISAAAEQPWRFWLGGDPTVSAYKAGGRTRQTLQAWTSRTCRHT